MAFGCQYVKLIVVINHINDTVFNILRHTYSKIKFVITLLLANFLILLPNSIASSYNSNNLPDLGNATSPILSPTDELELGRSVLNELQTSIKISNDSIVNEYLNSIGHRIVATFSQSQVKFNFFTVLDSHINAFALPGGFIGVNSGLILSSETESELAGVVAHEVSHVIQRHIARMYEHMGRVKISTIAGLIASIILATQNAEAGSGAMAATLAGSQQAMINFTREHEREADAVGIQAMAKAGFDPMGMPSFFHRMYQDTRFYGRWVPEYLLTHPLSSERLINAKSRAQSFPYKQIPDSLQFHLVKARLKVTTAKTPQESIEYFSKAIENRAYRNRQGALYGLALAYLNAGKPEQASDPIADLLTLSPHEPLYLLLQAEKSMHQHQPNTAILQLKKALQMHPKNFNLSTTLAYWLILQDQPTEAIRVIKKQKQTTPDRIELYALLANAYTKADRPLQAHITQAQAYKLQGDFRSALRQLNMAKRINNLSQRDLRQIEAQISEIELKS